jgi:hypothetical protein
MQRRVGLGVAAASMGLLLALEGCASSVDDNALRGTGGPVPTAVATVRPPATASGSVGAADATPVAPEGTTAASQRKTFTPKRIRLVAAKDVAAAVEAVDTGPDGSLPIPTNPRTVGWWVSGALGGEVFGSVVLAGHIDSRRHGLGFFVALLDARPGDRIELSGEGLRQVYVVRSNREVDKDVLSARTGVFDRQVAGRLVLITCTGTFDRRTRHYDHNLVVTADPLGVPVAL